MIKGIGVDILDLRRLSKRKDQLAKRILSKAEYQLYISKKSEKNKIEFLGGRFAGKEAYFKATASKKDFRDIEILNLDSGKPYINDKRAFISISHEKHYVIAYIVIEEG